jgi:hypothetical protein
MATTPDDSIEVDDRGIIRGRLDGGRLIVDLDRETYERLRDAYERGDPGDVSLHTFIMNYASLDEELRVEGERID